MYKRNAIIVLVALVALIVGLMVSIMGALIPDIIKTFNLSYTAAAVLPLSYYISFGILSIPAGIIIEKFTYKKVLIASYIFGIIGIIIFISFRNYYSSIVSLFIIGCALTVSQVAMFPLLREVVGADKLPVYSTLLQFTFGIGAFSSPYFYTLIIKGIANTSTNFPFNLLDFLSKDSYAWATVYWVFLLFFIFTVLYIAFVKFPPVRFSEEEKIGNKGAFKKLFSNKFVYLYFFGLFSYAACEQGNSNWLSQFLSTFHSVDPQTTGAMILSLYWLLLAVGCVAGMLLLKYFDSKKVLLGFSIGAMASLCFAIFGNRLISMVSFPMVGAFHSVMWPLIIALGMNSVKEHHGSLSGILYAASTGGAFGAMMVGKLGDLFGLRWGLLFLMICYSMVASVFFWSKPAEK